MPRPPLRQILMRSALAVARLAVILLWQASAWQNAVPPDHGPAGGQRAADHDRRHRDRDFGVLLFVARLFVLAKQALSGRLDRVMPRQVSQLIAAVAVVFLFWARSAASSVGPQVADNMSQQVDATIPPDTDPRPSAPSRARRRDRL
jgi:uncharacterized membrane protein